MSDVGDRLRIETHGPRGSRRIRLYIGEIHVITTSRCVVRSLALEDGQLAERKALCSAIREEESVWIKDRALRLLGYRERSRDELVRKLTGDGFSVESVCEVLDYLESIDLLSDSRFCGAFVRTKVIEGWGRRRITDSLLNFGVDSEMIEQALAADYPDDDHSRAASLIDPQRIRTAGDASRNIARLIRRGYPQNVAHDVVFHALRSNQNGSSIVE